MSTLYLETSAVLTWLFGESDAEQVRSVVDGAKTIATSELTLTECERALIRAEHQALLTGGDAQRLRGLLSRAKRAWVRMAVSDRVLARAAQSFPAEPVRTLDAIHLATALELTKAFPELRVLSFDRRVIDNAEALGIS